MSCCNYEDVPVWAVGFRWASPANRRHYATAFKNMEGKRVTFDGEQLPTFVVDEAMASLHAGEVSWAQVLIPVTNMPDQFRLCGGPNGDQLHFATRLVRGFVQVSG